MTISVGGVRVARVEGGMDSERTRTYSWQTCGHMACVRKTMFVQLYATSRRVCSQPGKEGRSTYTAEEMPYENHESAPRPVLVI